MVKSRFYKKRRLSKKKQSRRIRSNFRNKKIIVGGVLSGAIDLEHGDYKTKVFNIITTCELKTDGGISWYELLKKRIMQMDLLYTKKTLSLHKDDKEKTKETETIIKNLETEISKKGVTDKETIEEKISKWTKEMINFIKNNSRSLQNNSPSFYDTYENILFFVSQYYMLTYKQDYYLLMNRDFITNLQNFNRVIDLIRDGKIKIKPTPQPIDEIPAPMMSL